MRIIGKDLKQVVVDVVVFFRGEDQINFKIQSVHVGDEFDKLCLRPEPKTVTKKDGTTFSDTKDKKYQDDFLDWAKKRHDYMIIKSLSCNDDLEWDLVKMHDPSTWCMWLPEMEESGLTTAEINYLIDKIMSINSLNEDKMEEARKSFLAEMRGSQPEEN